MPVQTTDIILPSGDALTYSAIGQTWTILEDVTCATDQGFGVTSSQSSSRLINLGTVVSGNGIGVYFTAAGATVINEVSGSIIAPTGIAASGDFFTLQNYGLISSFDYAALSTISPNVNLTNMGMLHGGTWGIYFDGPVTEALVLNAGEIVGIARGIYHFGVGVLDLTNTGTISGHLAAVGVGGSGSMSLDNQGILDGGVEGGNQSDVLRNRGQIIGDVLLRAGNDTFDGRGGSTEGFSVSGEDGADSLGGSERDDFLSGGNDNDLLRGRQGDDILSGDNGADSLHGGRGADTFQYALTTDSRVAATQRDTIFDFRGSDGDVIDLSAIDAKSGGATNDAFTFIGTAAFSGTKGELRYEAASGGVLVLADSNGDGAGEMAILLQGVSSLTAADFVL